MMVTATMVPKCWMGVSDANMSTPKPAAVVAADPNIAPPVCVTVACTASSTVS